MNKGLGWRLLWLKGLKGELDVVCLEKETGTWGVCIELMLLI